MEKNRLYSLLLTIGWFLVLNAGITVCKAQYSTGFGSGYAMAEINKKAASINPVFRKKMIYPNPVLLEEVRNIHLPGTFQGLEIFSSDGKILAFGQTNEVIRFIKFPGVYFLRFRKEGKFYFEKLVVLQ